MLVTRYTCVMSTPTTMLQVDIHSNDESQVEELAKHKAARFVRRIAGRHTDLSDIVMMSNQNYGPSTSDCDTLYTAQHLVS